MPALATPAPSGGSRSELFACSRGLLGDVKPVGEGLSELRVDYGPGYRVYFVRRGAEVVILLCGGDKRTQERDISRAKLLAAEL